MEFSARPLDVLKDFLAGKRVVLFAMSTQTLVFVCEGEETPVFLSLETASISTPWADVGTMGRATALDISPCGRYAVTAHRDAGVVLWDAQLCVHVTTISWENNRSSAVFRVAIQPDCGAMLAATADGFLTPLRLKTIMSYTTVSCGTSICVSGNVLDVRAPSSRESMRQLFVVCLESLVIILELGDELQRVCEMHFDHPKVACYSMGWWSYFAVATRNKVIMLKLGETAEVLWERYASNVRDVVFLRPGLIGSLSDQKFLVDYVDSDTNEDLAVIDIGYECMGACACNGKVVLMPEEMLVFDNWKEQLEKLRKAGKLLEAVTLGMDVYLGKAKMFHCALSRRRELQNLVLECVEEFLEKESDDPAQFLEIAEAVVNMELSHQVITKKRSKGREAVLMALLDVASWRCDVTAEVIRTLPSADIARLDRDTLEEKLMNVVLPPSLTKTALDITAKCNTYNFLLHHFHTSYNTILPGFARAVEKADDIGLRKACQCVFTGENFTKDEVDQCIIWLLANEYERLTRCFEVDWEFAAQYFVTFLDHTPIHLSPSREISRKDMISVGLCCFAAAPKEHGDPLFELLVRESLKENVVIPADSLSNVLKFIFNSEIDRGIREQLFLRIIDVDYRDQLALNDFTRACVSAGFVSVLKRVYQDGDDCEPLITAMVLSDSPEDAFVFLENVSKSAHENAEMAVVTRFRPLLFLNSKRFIHLILNHFPQLHPTCVQRMRDTNVVVQYYDAFFEERKFGDNEDSKFYVRFLASRSVKDLVKLIRTKKIADDWVYSLCESKGLTLCCAVIDTVRKAWSPAYAHYGEVIAKQGAFDRKLCIEIVSHIKEISTPPEQVIRTLLTPLLSGPRKTDALEEILKHISENVEPLPVAMALAPLASSCKNKKTKWVLSSYMSCIDCCCTVNPDTHSDLCSSIDRIAAKSQGVTLARGHVTAATDDRNVTLLSTCDDCACATEMDEETLADVQLVIQQAESLAGIQGNRVPHDDLCHVMVMIAPPK